MMAVLAPVVLSFLLASPARGELLSAEALAGRAGMDSRFFRWLPAPDSPASGRSRPRTKASI